MRKTVENSFGDKWLSGLVTHRKWLSLPATFGIKQHTGSLESLQLRKAAVSAALNEKSGAPGGEPQIQDGKVTDNRRS